MVKSTSKRDRLSALRLRSPDKNRRQSVSYPFWRLFILPRDSASERASPRLSPANSSTVVRALPARCSKKNLTMSFDLFANDTCPRCRKPTKLEQHPTRRDLSLHRFK